MLQYTMVLTKQFEGCILHPYLCPAGVPTIGYGATFYEDGTPVTLHDPAITHERAERLLEATLVRTFYPAVEVNCPALGTEKRFAGVLDFTFNVGNNALRMSTARRRLNEGDWQAAARELRKWVKGGGKVLPGLVRRREAEIVYIL